MVLAEWTFIDMFWTMLVLFAWIMWFWLVIGTFTDIFRRNDISGWAKAGWTLLIFVVPLLGVLIYLVVRPKMTEQDKQLMAEYEEQRRRLRGTTPAEEIEKLAQLRSAGTITEEEFQALKAKAMA